MPTLEEIQEKYKNAILCINSFGTRFNILDYDISTLYEKHGNLWIKGKNGNNMISIYHSDKKEFAKILESK